MREFNGGGYYFRTYVCNPVALIKRLRSLLCQKLFGASIADYRLFGFEKKSFSEINRYLTWGRYLKLYDKLRETVGNNICGGDKFAEYDFFKEYIKRDWVKVTSNTTFDELHSFLKKYNEVIVKPRNGEQGHGVYKLTISDEKGVVKLLEDSRKSDYVVEEAVKNCDEIAAINESSLNTIRCYTFIDKKGCPHILEIMLRVGRAGSHVDNWGSGGIGYCFDVETGVCTQSGLDKLNNPYSFHPGSEYPMIGFKLPNFEQLKAYIYDIATIAPDARYVGWDIAVTPKGYDLIEVNCPGGHDFLQVFGRPWGDFIKRNW